MPVHMLACGLSALTGGRTPVECVCCCFYDSYLGCISVHTAAWQHLLQCNKQLCEHATYGGVVYSCVSFWWQALCGSLI